ncbi:MAG: hypothetical protein ACREMH_03465 [Gemmatimonadales bacterium]
MSTRTRRLLHPINQTSQLIKATVGVGAALATILGSAHSCGLLGSQSVGLGMPARAVAWVGITPASDTAESLGDSLRFVATLTDQHGAAIHGVAVRWSVADSSIVTVDSAGFVVARRPGVTRVQVTAGERTAIARVEVRQRPVALVLGPDSVIRVPEGATVKVPLHALDGRAREITAFSADWRSPDTVLAMVDAAGVVTGRTEGRVMISVSVGEVRDSIPVEVLPVPGRVLVVSGDGQQAPVGARVADPLVVKVESRSGRPMAGITVRFSADQGSGGAKPDSAVTGAGGLARTEWVLGDRPGIRQLRAAVAGVDSAASVSAEADPVAADTRISQVAVPPDAAVGAMITVAARLTDTLGRVLPGVPVRWSTPDGGSIAGLAARTDSMGEARAEWRLGKKAGAQRAQVRAGSARGVPPFTLVAAAFPAAPARSAFLSRPPFAGTVGAALKKPLVVQVTDSLGNPIPGVPVEVAPRAGSVASATTETDSTGRVSIVWTLGEKAGEQKLAVIAGELTPIETTARASARGPENLAFLEPPGTGRAGRSFGKIRVRVSDAYGNPLAKQLVVFSVAAGAVSPARVMTAADGTATVRWTLGGKAGPQVLRATVSRTKVGQRLEVQATR